MLAGRNSDVTKMLDLVTIEILEFLIIFKTITFILYLINLDRFFSSLQFWWLIYVVCILLRKHMRDVARILHVCYTFVFSHIAQCCKQVYIDNVGFADTNVDSIDVFVADDDANKWGFIAYVIVFCYKSVLKMLQLLSQVLQIREKNC